MARRNRPQESVLKLFGAPLPGEFRALAWKDLLHFGNHRIGVKNDEVIESIASDSKIPVQVGGGIRSIAAIGKRLESNIARVVVGTLAFSAPFELEEALRIYGPKKIVVAADYRKGSIATKGWTQDNGVSILDAVKRLEKAGVQTVLVTSVDMDGTALGPDLETLRNIHAASKMNVLASGGIRSSEDVRELERIGAAGIVLGRALYEGTISISELRLQA